VTLSVLIVDDDESVREILGDYFEALGHTARSVATASDGRRAATEHSPDVVLVDLRLPDGDGLHLVEALRADDPDVGIVVLTGHADVATAVRAMRLGAGDLLEKPVTLEALRDAVERVAGSARMRRELEHLRSRPLGDVAPGAVAPGLEKLIALAARNADVPVLLLGESGTGKTVVARRIHELSSRAAAPFVAVNCASLAPALFESELFGHERGAFTDARTAKHGLLEIAGGGTVLLDEIADLAPAAQPKLLTVIEDSAFRRVGGTTTLRSDARLIAATNSPLRTAVDAGRFRADLFYRLQVLTIEIAPLRARRGEIPALATALLPRAATLTAGARRALSAYDWPGNVRELRNVLWRASILAEGVPIEPEHLGLEGVSSGDMDERGEGSLAAAERRAIAAALEATGGNKRQAAERLGIARSTLIEKVRRFGLADI
jgi:DNA-binding NtrC family response regulator